MPSATRAALDALIADVGGRGVAPPVASPAPAPAPAPASVKEAKAPAPAAPAPAAPACDSATVAADPEVEKKLALVRSVGEECVTEAELRNILVKKPNFVLYDGFEPSGRMHIAQGVFKALNVNKCTAAGGTFIFWVADWFALMNDKMGGDLERIKTVGQ